MNALGYDNLAKSRGINLDVELAVGRSDFEAAIRPGNGLHTRFAVPDLAVIRDRDSIRFRLRAAGDIPIPW